MLAGHACALAGRARDLTVSEPPIPQRFVNGLDLAMHILRVALIPSERVHGPGIERLAQQHVDDGMILVHSQDQRSVPIR